MAPSLKRAFKYLIHNRAQFCDSIVCNFLKFLPDKLYLSLRFRCKMGYWMNWKKPVTFSEKLQWLKVYNRKSEYTTLVDKYLVKDHVAEIIGREYIIPTIGVWDSVDNIDWNTLPNKFVLKTTHGGGGTGVIICRDKDNLDIEEVKMKLSGSLKSDIFSILREWPYKDVRKRIIAEELLMSDDGIHSDLPDYKFFCFNGMPMYCQVISGRSDVMTVDFYNSMWEHQEFHEPKFTPFSQTRHERPNQFDSMWKLAELLAKDHPFIRVDFYEVNNKVYFGELTFYPTSGFGGFDPKCWDEYFGTLIKLN